MAFEYRLILRTLSLWIFALTVVLLPVGLGGDRPLPLGLAQFGFGFSGLLIALDASIWRDPRFSHQLYLACLLFFLVVFWAWIQTTGFLSPQWSHPLWQEAAAALNVPLSPGIALDPEAAGFGISRLITYFAAGFLAYLIAREPKQAEKLVRLLWQGGVLICLYGLAEYASGSETILWFKKWAYRGDLTATFVNHNHFAIFAAMVLVIGTALTVQSLHRAWQSPPRRAASATLQLWLMQKGFWRILACLLVFITILFSHSRAGLLLSLSGIYMYIFFYHIYLSRFRAAFIIGFIGVMALAISTALATHYIDHFATLLSDDSSYERVELYEIMLRAIGDNPWLGTGLNSFQAIFRIYQHGMSQEFDRGHSDIIESMLDLGIPAACCLWASVMLLLAGLWHGLRVRRRHGMYACLGLSAAVLVILHSAVDFSLQIPGVAIYMAALIGIGLAQSWNTAVD